MFILDVVKDSDEPIVNRKVFRFCEAEVNRLHDAFVCPCSEAEDTEGECDDDDDILTLDVDGEALGEEMECELENQAEQDADRVRTISSRATQQRRARIT